MKKVSLITLFFLITISYSSYSFDDVDFQYWNNESISVKIDDDWAVGLGQEFRFGDDAGRLYYQHSDLGLKYSGLTKWLDLGLNFRLVREDKNDNWQYEYRPHLNAVLKCQNNGFSLSNRSRFEYRDKESGENGWRYRNKLTLKFPVKFTRLQIRPYLADEIFVDFIEEELNKNRFYCGADFKILSNLKAQVYFLRQSTKKRDNWRITNIIGTEIKLFF